MSISIEIDTRIFTQHEVTTATKIPPVRLNNNLARLRKVAPKLGGRPGTGERRRFSFAEVRILWIMEDASDLLGDLEAAKAGIAIAGRIWGEVPVEPEGCLVASRRFAPRPPGEPHRRTKKEYDFCLYQEGPPAGILVRDTVALIPYGRLIKEADDACQAILNNRGNRSKFDSETAATISALKLDRVGGMAVQNN